MTFETVRELALALPEVEESTSWGTPAVKVRRKLIARLQEEGDVLVVRIDLADRELLLNAAGPSGADRVHAPCRSHVPVLRGQHIGAYRGLEKHDVPEQGACAGVEGTAGPRGPGRCLRHASSSARVAAMLAPQRAREVTQAIDEFQARPSSVRP